MSAVASPVYGVLDERQSARAEAMAIYVVSRRLTDDYLRRLDRQCDGLVRLLDRIQQTRDNIERGQILQVSCLQAFAITDRVSKDPDGPW